MKEILCEIRNLTFSYGNKPLFNELNLEIREGEAILLGGPNGGGKSTLLKIIAGLLTPQKGRIYMLPPKREIAFISEKLSCFEELTVAGLIRLHLRTFKCREHYDKPLQILNLNGRKRVYELSRGERAILLLSLALSQEPRLLMLDDFIAQIDPFFQEIFVKSLIDSLAGNKITMVIASHSSEQLENVCERLLFLKKGAPIQDTEIEPLRNSITRIVSRESLQLESEVIYRNEEGFFKQYYVRDISEKERDLPGTEQFAVSLQETLRALIARAYGTGNGRLDRKMAHGERNGESDS